jgi:hypothetical protein
VKVGKAIGLDRGKASQDIPTAPGIIIPRGSSYFQGRVNVLLGK